MLQRFPGGFADSVGVSGSEIFYVTIEWVAAGPNEQVGVTLGIMGEEH